MLLQLASACVGTATFLYAVGLGLVALKNFDTTLEDCPTELSVYIESEDIYPCTPPGSHHLRPDTAPDILCLHLEKIGLAANTLLQAYKQSSERHFLCSEYR